MIAVIADDFTGAAEIGGIALRHGYNAVFTTNLETRYDTDVLIIATDTRSEPPEKAREIIRELTLQLLELGPELIYKKIDSVLRGNVGEELMEQMEVSSKKRALIIPPNPSLNRIIKDGIYYYEGAPLNSSNFSMESAIKNNSSKVLDLIGEKSAHYTTIISNGDSLPAEGLIIGNTVDETDLTHWAEKLDNETLMAGGSSFFNAILRKIRLHPIADPEQSLVVGKNRIYVCGSAFPFSRRVVAASFNNGRFVAYMPSDMFCESANMETLLMAWEDKIIKGICETGQVIIAIDDLKCPGSANLATDISKVIATVVERVMLRIKVEELIIEGGATASSIIKKLKYKKFYPVQELAVGVIRMKVEENKDLFITMKPGSYHWPASIWNYNKSIEI
ncbi:four-carbon acid sugar kinase family protein [Pedobacter immunditicola]|uniref:four-carbon acid sugar kinase family protein n=1 Tax=Pedobacter immunditicola TaxID=3133440 RepID=UPI00309D6371